MSAKRPRPAIPVLVHVDNPTEVGSVTVDVSTIEGKMDTVITNQNRIYDKIPTSAGGGGGGSADLTTVNEKTTALAAAIGPADATTGDRNLNGAVRNLVGSIGDFNASVSPSGGTVKAFLNNIRNGIGDVSNPPTTSGSSVRDLLFTLKGSIGPANSTAADSNLLGSVKNLIGSIGSSNGGIFLKDKTIRSILYNLREGIGNAENSPTSTETTVRGLLTAIKENTASGGSGGGGGSADLTTVNEKTTALAAAIGSASDDASTVSVIGLLKSITDKY